MSRRETDVNREEDKSVESMVGRSAQSRNMWTQIPPYAICAHVSLQNESWCNLEV